MKRKWFKPTSSFVSIDLRGLEDVERLTDIELGEELEKRGYKSQKEYQTSAKDIHKKIAGADESI